MTTLCDMVLVGGSVVTPSGICETDIAVSKGKIVAIGDVSSYTAKKKIDCKKLHILPGVIDTQVHFRDPGMEHKETLETGTMSAVAGGVTSVFEMPNTNPLTVTPEAIAGKIAKAKKGAWCDYAFYLGGTAENAPNLPEWENLHGVCGIKIFMGSSTGSLLTATDEEVESVLANGRRVVAVHSEDEMMMQKNRVEILGDKTDVALHPVWRSAEGCLSSTKRLINIARKTKRKVHVLHISTAEEMEFLKDHKDIASVEVLVNHLSFYAPDCYEKLGSRVQQNPPIREKHHNEALWKALADGTVDILASDHAPHTLDEKSKPYPQSPSGSPGVQTLVPIMLDHVNAGRLSLERFVDLTAYGPQRVHGIRGKGRIAVGYDADFTVVDMKLEKEITDADQKSKSGWTPYAGRKVKGYPVMTIIRGNTVMSDGELQGTPMGEAVEFFDNMRAFGS